MSERAYKLGFIALFVLAAFGFAAIGEEQASGLLLMAAAAAVVLL